MFQAVWIVLHIPVFAFLAYVLLHEDLHKAVCAWSASHEQPAQSHGSATTSPEVNLLPINLRCLNTFANASVNTLNLQLEIKYRYMPDEKIKIRNVINNLSVLGYQPKARETGSESNAQ